MDRTKASNAQVATVDLYAGMLAEAEDERRQAQSEANRLGLAVKMQSNQFDRIVVALETFSPGLTAPGKMGSELLGLTVGAVLGEATLIRAKYEARGETLARVRAALIMFLVNVGGVPGYELGMLDEVEPSLDGVVGAVGVRLAELTGKVAKKGMRLRRGSHAVVEAARVLVQHLGDTHVLAGNHWKLAKAVRDLGSPGPSAAYRKAERAAAELAISVYQDPAYASSSDGGLTLLQAFSNIGKALVEAEAAIKVKNPKPPRAGEVAVSKTINVQAAVVV